jgi:membrane-associated phospholipid phosphatase
LLSLIALTIVAPAHGQSLGGGATGAAALRLRTHWADYSATPVLLGLALKPPLPEPKKCGWCDSNWLDDGARSWFGARKHWAQKGYDQFSYVTLYATAGATLMDPAFRGGGWQRAGRNVLLVSEAVAADAFLNVLVKRAVRRERPYAKNRAKDGSGYGSSSDDNQSFFSGHTSTAFAWAAAACHVRTYERARTSSWGCVVPYATATATGFLRMNADKHWLSDVLVGAAVGYAIGRLIPSLHDEQPVAQPAQSGRGLVAPFQVRFSW